MCHVNCFALNIFYLSSIRSEKAINRHLLKVYVKVFLIEISHFHRTFTSDLKRRNFLTSDENEYEEQPTDKTAASLPVSFKVSILTEAKLLSCYYQ